MLLRSQPIDPKKYKKLGLPDNKERPEPEIISQRIGDLFDDVLAESKERKPSLKTRLNWKRRRIKERFYDVKHSLRNHVKWHKTLSRLRPWEGFSGMIRVMQTHLADYIRTEQKYGHSTEEYKKHKIATARETLRLLSRMKEPLDYSLRRRDEVSAKYPKYKSLITRNSDGSVSTSGDFIALGKGWVGRESGKDPRSGYFELRAGRFEPAQSPNQEETERLLTQLDDYREAVENAYKQAEIDSDNDFERLGQLLKDNMYSWWD
jgi:flagellar motility protein MotE (MotC chaperone)